MRLLVVSAIVGGCVALHAWLVPAPDANDAGRAPQAAAAATPPAEVVAVRPTFDAVAECDATDRLATARAPGRAPERSLAPACGD